MSKKKPPKTVTVPHIDGTKSLAPGLVPRETLGDTSFEIEGVPVTEKIPVEMTKIDRGVEAGKALKELETLIGVNIVPHFERGSPTSKLVEPDLPEVLSLSIVRIKNAWALARLTTKGKKVVDIQYGEPSGFRFAFEDFKLAAMHEFHDKS